MNEVLAQHYQDGFDAFSEVDEIRRRKRGIIYHQKANPLKANGKYTHSAHREWQRGWNAAYFKNLEKQNGLGARS